MTTLLDLSLATRGAVADRRAARQATSTRRRGTHVPIEVGSAFFVSAVAALALGATASALIAQLVLWATVSYWRPAPVTGPVLRQARPFAQAALATLAATAVGSALGFAALTGPAAVVPIVLAAAAAAGVRLGGLALAGPTRVLVVGDLSAVSEAATHWRGTAGVKVVGHLVVQDDVDDRRLPTDLFGVPVFAGLDRVALVADACSPDLVVLAPGTGLTKADVRRLTWMLQDSPAGVAMLGLFDAVSSDRVSAGELGSETLCEIDAPKGSRAARLVKATVDRTAAALLLVVLFPVLLTVAVAIRLDSRGPVFFKQTRVGQHGSLFPVMKFRTMRTDAEVLKEQLLDSSDYSGILFKMKNDPRITRLGRFLRKSSLDELPQLLNVLRGEMSLIGPRPFVPSETAAMTTDELRRLAVKPGITGLWQVSGRSDLAWDESVALDTYYADNWNLSKDAVIAARTVGAVLNGKGAY